MISMQENHVLFNPSIGEFRIESSGDGGRRKRPKYRDDREKRKGTKFERVLDLSLRKAIIIGSQVGGRGLW